MKRDAFLPQGLILSSEDYCQSSPQHQTETQKKTLGHEIHLDVALTHMTYYEYCCSTLHGKNIPYSTPCHTAKIVQEWIKEHDGLEGSIVFLLAHHIRQVVLLICHGPIKEFKFSKPS